MSQLERFDWEPNSGDWQIEVVSHTGKELTPHLNDGLGETTSHADGRLITVRIIFRLPN